MAEQIAQAANEFETRQRQGHQPQSVTVVMSGDTLVITLHGSLSPSKRYWLKVRRARPRFRSFIDSYS